MSPQGKSSSKSSRAKHENTFFDILKQDHEKITEIFEKIEEDEGENREELYAGLRSELLEHFQLEESFFYPILDQNEATHDAALDAFEEHGLVKVVLSDCNSLDPEDERWNAKLKLMKTLVNHHVQEEEKNIFKTAKKALGQDRIKQITEQMMQQQSQAEKKAA